MKIKEKVDGIDRRIEALLKSQEKTDEQQKKTEQEIRELRAAQEKTDEQQKKTDEQLRKTDKEIDRVARDIGGGLGRAAEGLAAPSVPKLFEELGIKVDEVQQRVRAFQDRQIKAEVDLICPGSLNGEEIVLVGEVKAHLTVDDIKDFLADDLKNFKDYFPRYREIKAYGLVAGLYVGGDLAKFASRQGLYILTPSGDTMCILNPVDFKPKVW